jgi:serine/threonine protein kinase
MFTDNKKKHIKIIDFGVSGLIIGEKSTAGSIKYMAPELVSGSDIESKPSLDIWSLGCILHELLSGESIFKGKKKRNIRVSM